MNTLLSIVVFFGLSTAFAGPSYTSKAKAQFTTPKDTTIMLELDQVCYLGNGLLKSKAPVEFCSERKLVGGSLVCTSTDTAVLTAAKFYAKRICMNRSCSKSKITIVNNSKGHDRTYRNGVLVISKPVEIEFCN